MACKFLTQKIQIMPQEAGGPITPQGVPIPACGLNREPDIIGWVNRCQKTPSEGPCWFWLEERGTETPDLEFNLRK